MKVRNIVEALNHYYAKRFPNATGWFIGKESFEPTKLNAYKKYKIEIYYHLPGKNYIAYQQQVIDRCPEGTEEILKEKCITDLLTGLFNNLLEFDKYETI